MSDRIQARQFEAVREPVDTWLVFDAVTGCPAEVGTRVLIGLEKRDALLLAWVLEGGRPRLLEPMPGTRTKRPSGMPSDPNSANDKLLVFRAVLDETIWGREDRTLPI